MTLNSERSQNLIVRHLPKFMPNLGRDFAMIKGSRVYQALQDGHPPNDHIVSFGSQRKVDRALGLGFSKTPAHLPIPRCLPDSHRVP
jgi:hypothetical protein